MFWNSFLFAGAKRMWPPAVLAVGVSFPSFT